MKIVLYILALFISVSVFAQPKLGMHANYSITPASATTASLGLPYTSTITVISFVQNKGNAAFNGPVILYRSVHSSSLQSAAVPVAQVTVALNVNDTIRVTYIDTITPGEFKVNGNGNTIVVWPYSSSALTKDSLFTAPVYVNDPTGIKELDRNKLFLYPNPVAQTLFIMPESGVEYKDITVYDLQMKILMQLPYTESIDVGLLPSATYIIMVSDTKGRRYGSRFTKNE